MNIPAAATFNHPEWIRAILAHVESGTAVFEASEGAFALHAAVPKSFPLAHYDSLVTPLSPGGLPSALTIPDVKEARSFLKSLARPIMLRNVRADHPVIQALMDASSHCHVARTWERAALRMSGTFDDWMMANFDHKRRKEVKRLRARLSEQGALQFRHLASDQELSPYIEGFLAVEASGWKGQRGTAIQSDRAMEAALRQGLAAMQANGTLRFWEMRLDGKPIASLFAFVHGGECTLGKIGFDEAWSKYSPGVLMIIEATQALFSEPGLTLADANAIPGHPMIDRIWRDRVPCMDVVLAGENTTAFTFQIVTRFHGTKHATRQLAKETYLRLTGRKAS